MAQHYGFFNARKGEGGTFDRKYNANDYSDNLAVVISNGVLRSINDDLKVTSNGMTATVAAGRAWINGHYYYNDSPHSFTSVSAPIAGKRWDRIFLRMSKEINDRHVVLVYVKGEEAPSPVKPTPIRTESIYDLVLADIYVDTNATSVEVTDTRADADLCGWVFSTSGDNSFFTSLDNSFSEWFRDRKDTLSSVTLFKRYHWRTVLESESHAVKFSIPQWDSETCFIEVYVNGILEHESVHYTLDGANSIVTFSDLLIVGTEIIVKVYKSIDGTGIETVADEITALQNAVAALNSEEEFKYHCNSIDDNVKLSQIAEAWLNGGTDYASKTVRVYGTFGCSAPYVGAGNDVNPKRWICVGGESATNRRLVFDFSSCSEINLPITANTSNFVFYGHDAHIIGASVIANQTAPGTTIKAFNPTESGGAVRAENCRFWLTANGSTRVSYRGTFVNCYACVSNESGNSYCFEPQDLLRIEGGEYYAYTRGSDSKSAVVGQSARNAVSILNGVNAPTLSKSGFYQTNSVLQWTGGGELRCTDLVSELDIVVVAGIAEIRGTIKKSKAGEM